MVFFALFIFAAIVVIFLLFGMLEFLLIFTAGIVVGVFCWLGFIQRPFLHGFPRISQIEYWQKFALPAYNSLFYLRMSVVVMAAIEAILTLGHGQVGDFLLLVIGMFLFVIANFWQSNLVNGYSETALIDDDDDDDVDVADMTDDLDNIFIARMYWVLAGWFFILWAI